MSEIRVIDPITGGEKGKKACELALIDAEALIEVGKVAGFGAQKYDDFNYLKGYKWTLSLSAAFRHLLAVCRGEDRDPESGLLHAAHLAWHGLALCSFAIHKLGTDDRFKSSLLGRDGSPIGEVGSVEGSPQEGSRSDLITVGSDPKGVEAGLVGKPTTMLRTEHLVGVTFPGSVEKGKESEEIVALSPYTFMPRHRLGESRERDWPTDIEKAPLVGDVRV